MKAKFNINDAVRIISDTYKGKTGVIKIIYNYLLPGKSVYEVQLSKNHRGQFTENQLKKIYVGGLSQCSNCYQYYCLPEEFNADLDKACIIEHKPYYEGIIECICGKLRIAGGELDYDLYNDKDCILMFEKKYSHHNANSKELKCYKAVMLEPCEEEVSMASTWDINTKSTIYLKLV